MSAATSDPADAAPGAVRVPVPSSRDAALISAGQGVIMVFGGLLALLVGQTFGKNTETDAFFAAYGVYAVGLVLAQTFRLGAVSRVVRDPGPTTETIMLGAVAVLVLAAGTIMAGLAGPVAGALVASDPTGAGPTAMRFLWLALAGQLTAAMLAMFLSTRGAFMAQGLVMLTTGVISLGSFALLYSAAGVDAASMALAAAGVWFCVALFGVLWGRGWRPVPPSVVLLRAMVREAGVLLYASVTFIGATVAYVLSQAIAGREGAGEATLYSYAFVLAAMLVGVTSNVAATVRSPSLIASDHRTDDAAAVGELTLRYTVVLGGPGIALLLLVGPSALQFALGYGSGDTWSIVLTAACFAGWVVGSAAGVFAVVELLARGELARLAALAAAQAAGAAVFAWVGGRTAGIEGVAVGLSLAALAVSAVQLRLAYRERWAATARRMLHDSARELAVIAGASAVPAAILLVTGSSVPGVVAAGACGCVLLGLATRAAWPDEFRTLAAIAGRQV